MTSTNPVVVGSQGTSREAEQLMQKLDDLLEQYLNILDEYQKAREQLSTHLSSGYMALAQANFANKTGRRYGQDYYDERMQAQRIVEISQPSESSVESVLFKCMKTSDSEEAESTQEITEDRQPDEAKPKSRDPLRWFGVLVPPPLRIAQTSFISAVEASIPDLLNLQQSLRSLEIEIGRTRKSIKKLGKV